MRGEGYERRGIWESTGSEWCLGLGDTYETGFALFSHLKPLLRDARVILIVLIGPTNQARSVERNGNNVFYTGYPKLPRQTTR